MTNSFVSTCKFLLIALVFVMIAWAVFGGQILLGDHATIRHGSEAITARDCGLNPMMTMYRPSDGHFADICKTSDGLFGVFVYNMMNGVKKEVTAFQKNKMRTVEQVIKYLQNAGYK